MTTRATGGDPHATPSATPPAVEYAQVVRRLTRAATRSGASLVAETAALVDGWAALVDPLAGVVHSTPRSAGAAGLRAVTQPQPHSRLSLHQVSGAGGPVLVLAPAAGVSASLATLTARTAVNLLRVRARRAEETRGAEQRLHTAVLRLLLRGRADAAAEVLGTSATHATVYRLTGPGAGAAHEALWRATQTEVSGAGPRVLVCLDGAELAVVACHGATGPHGVHGDQDPTRPLVARLADRHRLLCGVAAPAPLDMFVTAWAEAGAARDGAAVGRLAAAHGLGAHGLLHVVPPDRLAAWSAAVLQPLDGEQRRTLEAWLRSGSAQAATAALGVSEGTVRARLRGVGARLAADLDHPTVQAQLLLALRVPAGPARATAAAPVLPHPPLPAALLGREHARGWASALLEPLDKRLRIALRCWLAHRGRTAPAAAELVLHRTTLTTWLGECGRALGLDLSSATVRAELRLAVETAAAPDDVPAALPRRGGRTYRGPRP
ncbi:helix-turn-helix domain-containing protein [Streptomyces longispororuber]|uniref:helix-turn-helix domain-containing protein n=1 Tax=Streptomyces longispororuber TaxID=68230 RepID=UPI0036FDBA25